MSASLDPLPDCAAVLTQPAETAGADWLHQQLHHGVRGPPRTLLDRLDRSAPQPHSRSCSAHLADALLVLPSAQPCRDAWERPSATIRGEY